MRVARFVVFRPVSAPHRVTTPESPLPKRLLKLSLLVALAACDTSTPVAPAVDGTGAHPEFGTS